ncbi:MAG: electron transfer flavoprotein subunit alpha/FixB family protein [Arcanobacterium sp.]
MTTWIITSSSKISNLFDTAREIGGAVNVVVVGDAKVGGDAVIRLPLADNQPVEALSGAVADVINAEPGDVVLAGNTSADRVLAGAVAARFDAPLLQSAKTIKAGEAVLSRFGGLSDETVSFDSVVVAVLDGGDALTADAGAETVKEVSGYSATVTEVNTEDTQTGDISLATRVIGAGRGFAEKEDLGLARELADVLGAEIGVTRPLAEGHGWAPRNSYIGVSGHVIAPELYIAVGLSGQIHHTAGVTDSEVIVAINDDELSEIFKFADYGIVGDLYEVLPELTEVVKGLE